MTATAEQKTLMDAIGELKSMGTDLHAVVKTLNSPLRANVRRDEHNRVTSYFEETDETVDLKFGETHDAQVRKSYKQLKKQAGRELHAAGYVPHGVFKNFRDFVKEGLDANDGKSSTFQDRVRSHCKAIQGMSETVGADGGFTVMPEFAPGIIDRVYANDLFSRTDNYTVTGNNMTFLVNAETSRATGSRHGGLQGYWVPEGGTITKSKPTTRQVTLKLIKLAVVVYLTDELLADTGFAVQQYVNRKAGEEFNFLIGDALINGTGVGKPLGMLNFPSLVSVAKQAGQAAATFQTENVVSMFARFYAANLNKLVWLHNQDIHPQLHTMTIGVGTGGTVTYMPPGGISSAPYATLMGRPMLPTEFNSTLGTQGDVIAADMSQILSITKGGVMQAVSPHIEFLTDQMAVRLTMRLNAGPWESAPITPFKGSANTQASFVTLDTRS